MTVINYFKYSKMFEHSSSYFKGGGKITIYNLTELYSLLKSKFKFINSVFYKHDLFVIDLEPIRIKELIKLTKTCNELFEWNFEKIKLFSKHKYTNKSIFLLEFNDIEKFKEYECVNGISTIQIYFNSKIEKEITRITFTTFYTIIQKNDLEYTRNKGLIANDKIILYTNLQECLKMIDNKKLVLRILPNLLKDYFKENTLFEYLEGEYYTCDNIQNYYLQYFNEKTNTWEFVL